eukprot:6190025-Amphidinium_carterae.1
MGFFEGLAEKASFMACCVSIQSIEPDHKSVGTLPVHHSATSDHRFQRCNVDRLAADHRCSQHDNVKSDRS